MDWLNIKKEGDFLTLLKEVKEVKEVNRKIEAKETLTYLRSDDSGICEGTTSMFCTERDRNMLRHKAGSAKFCVSRAF